MNKFKPEKKSPNSEKIVISIRMPIDKINEIDEIAAKIDISRNELINQCVNYALSNIEFKRENELEKD